MPSLSRKRRPAYTRADTRAAAARRPAPRNRTLHCASLLTPCFCTLRFVLAGTSASTTAPWCRSISTSTSAPRSRSSTCTWPTRTSSSKSWPRSRPRSEGCVVHASNRACAPCNMAYTCHASEEVTCEPVATCLAPASHPRLVTHASQPVRRHRFTRGFARRDARRRFAARGAGGAPTEGRGARRDARRCLAARSAGGAPTEGRGARRDARRCKGRSRR